MRRERNNLLGDPGEHHYQIRRVHMLVSSDRYQSKNSTRYFERLGELESMVSVLNKYGRVRVPKRTALELFAFQFNEKVRLRDMVDRERFVEGQIVQQTPVLLKKW